MSDPDRPIPRQADVPFHIAVKREELALPVECEVIRIAKAGDDPFPGLSFVIAAQDLAPGGHDARGMASSVVVMGKQLSLVGDVHRTVRVDRRPQVGMVAVAEIEPAVGAEFDRVGTVLAHAARALTDQRTVAVNPLGIGVREAVDAGPFGALTHNE